MKEIVNFLHLKGKVRWYLPGVPNHPLINQIFLSLPLFFGIKIIKKYRPGFQLRGLLPISLTMLAIFITVCALHLFSGNLFDFNESQIVSVAWAHFAGLPLYHDLDSVKRYSILYGPTLYLTIGFFLKLLGPTLFHAKLPTFIASILGTTLNFLSLKNYTSYKRALLITALLALSTFTFGQPIVATRSDPLMYFAVSLGFFAATRNSSRIRIILGALALGYGANLKLHGVFYFLPVLTLIAQKSKPKDLAILLGLAVILAALPFLLDDGISLEHYLLWVKLTVGHGLSLDSAFSNLEWALFFATLICVSGFRLLNKHRWFLGALILSTLQACVAGSLAWAGKSHLLSLLPGFALLMAMVVDEIHWNHIKSALVCAFGLSIAVLGFRQVREFLPQSLARESIPIQNDLKNLLARLPENELVMMGYGEKEPYAFARPLVTFKYPDVFLDEAGISDESMSRIPVPESVLDSFKNCYPRAWIIPKGEKPFAIHRVTPPYPELFSERLRAEFTKDYAISERSDFFELWRCRQRPVE